MPSTIRNPVTAVVAILLGLLPSSVEAELGRPLQVFILAGQSNMQGHAHVRTFDAMRLRPTTASLLEEMRATDGTPVVCDRVWIASIGSSEEEKVGRLTVGFGAEARGPKIGPEFTFGITAARLLDEPILIIKTAWGGKSLHTDFRSPSAGPFEFSESHLERLRQRDKNISEVQAEKVEATGRYYRLMLDHIKRTLADIRRVCPEYSEGDGYELAGFVWFQGWNDMVDQSVYPQRGRPGGYDAYSDVLTHLIRDVRQDLDAPRLPFVIGVMGVGGPTALYQEDQRRYRDVHQTFRNAMAAPAASPEFHGNVAAVLTEDFWDMDVVELRRREKTLKPKVETIKDAMKSGDITKAVGQQQIDALYEAEFDNRERELLQESTSNFDFHYMGSACLIAQIGQAFAEAAVSMQSKD